MTKEDSVQLVNLVAHLMNVELQQTVLASDDKTLKSKSVTGRFPVLETKEGARIADSLPIVRFLSNGHASFLGTSAD
jgi:glutaredoxin 2